MNAHNPFLIAVPIAPRPNGWRWYVSVDCPWLWLRLVWINWLRHSYASFRLAAIHDAPRVASELGHTSPQMLYNTYRELVLPAEAERYWKVTPVAKGCGVVPFSA